MLKVRQGVFISYSFPDFGMIVVLARAVRLVNYPRQYFFVVRPGALVCLKEREYSRFRCLHFRSFSFFKGVNGRVFFGHVTSRPVR